MKEENRSIDEKELSTQEMTMKPSEEEGEKISECDYCPMICLLKSVSLFVLNACFESCSL